MSEKITIDDKEYDTEFLSEKGFDTLALVRFTLSREKELANVKSLLQKAKNAYVDDLKKEILSGKTGMLFGNE